MSSTEPRFSRGGVAPGWIGVVPVLTSLAALSSARAADTLSESEAVEKALQANPELRVLIEKETIATAAKADASYLSNPEVELEWESARQRSGGPRFRNAPEALTARLSQEIPFPGVVSARREGADARGDLFRLEAARRKAEVRATARQSFLELLSGQRAVELVRERVKLASEFLSTARARVEAGKVPGLDAERLESSLALVQSELAVAEAQTKEAALRLVALWSGTGTSLPLATGDLFRYVPPPARAPSLDGARLAVSDAELRVARAELSAANLSSVPGVTVGLAWTRFPLDDRHGFGVSLSAPLPLFTTNAEARALARAEEIGRKLERERAHAQGPLSSGARYLVLKAAYEKARSLTGDIVPRARGVAERVREAYASGKLPALDAIDAQAQLAEILEKELEAATSYQSRRIEFERLVEESEATGHQRGTRE